MSICIIGGNERMERQYVNICKKHNCKAKVFTRMKGNLKDQIGSPDLIVLFTNTVMETMPKTSTGMIVTANIFFLRFMLYSSHYSLTVLLSRF